MSRTDRATRRRWRFGDDGARAEAVEVATEEPCQIQVFAGGRARTAAVTMRTPGDDFALAAGFLYGEGLLARRDDIARIDRCVDPDLDDDARGNVVQVELANDPGAPLDRLERHFTMTSACGVCGRATVDDLASRALPALPPGPPVDPAVIRALPDQLRAAQGAFDATGGLHAAGLFDRRGRLLDVCEDVGRHNALDKLVGRALLAGALPWSDRIVLVSGRASFELVAKARCAGAPLLCAVSAPSSLAIETAASLDLTLVAFLRDDGFSAYAGASRIRGSFAAPAAPGRTGGNPDSTADPPPHRG